MGLAAAVGFCGCESTDGHSTSGATAAPNAAAESRLLDVPTADLKARRMEVFKHYAQIQRDVELKAGLPMGVAIKDDRALLGELYREAHEIDRELRRRFTLGDPEVTMELVSGKW
jgi:hypothetical protein